MFNLIIGILEHEGLPYVPIMDPGVIIRHKKGCISPSSVCGVYVFPKDEKNREIITNFYEAVDYINRKGLKRC